jgi:hypothetical protein
MTTDRFRRRDGVARVRGMRLEVQGGVSRVALSERNLRALLAKLGDSPPNSACTISYDTKDGLVLYVSAEPNDIHYANPERDTPMPGPMYPDTEERIR